MNDMNNKSTPNQMRVLLKRMRGEEFIVGESKKDEPKKTMTMRDMLKITRSLNEQEEKDEDKKKGENKKNVYDQEREEEKFRNFFNDMNVTIDFIEMEIYDNLVFWGGTVDGVIQFIYKVTPNESTSGVEFNYLDDFTPDNPDNEKIIEKLESYFDSFYKYWRNNMVQK
jgi:hypothetical protein